MREYPWSDVLAEFKASEVDEALIFVIEDGWLRRLLAAWSVLPGIRFPDRHQLTAYGWSALWRDVTFDLELLANHLDTGEGHAQQLFERARSLMLIYPDGSLHAKAQKLLRDRVREEVEKGDEEPDDG